VQLESEMPLQPESPNPTQTPNPTPVQPQSQNPVEPLNPKPVQAQSERPVPQQPDGNRPIAAAATSARSPSIGFQTLAAAYADYTRKSFEETRAFIEKLSGARSLDKAIEIQTEYAKQACQTFVAESERIRNLHRELAKQILKPLEGFVAKPTRDHR
jgi:phasin family protein